MLPRSRHCLKPVVGVTAGRKPVVPELVCRRRCVPWRFSAPPARTVVGLVTAGAREAAQKQISTVYFGSAVFWMVRLMRLIMGSFGDLAVLHYRRRWSVCRWPPWAMLVIKSLAYSCSDIAGSFSRKPTVAQISSSLWSFQDGMPVILMPCLTIQNSSAGL